MKLFLNLILISLASTNIMYAQKLPNVQTVGVLAPANIKIDGKATEWNNQFQAFNHAVLFYYTLANDKDNLYLAVQATDPDIVKRILNGGITLAVNTTGDKKDKNMPSITFPVSGPGNKVNILSLKNTPGGIAAMSAHTDSFMRAKNNEMSTKFKTIKTNVKQLDSLISVYNTDNVRVAELLDINMVYTYELAIPLKYLEIDKASKFTYHITINAVKESGVSRPNHINPPVPGQRVLMVSVNLKTYAPGQDATDFWGEYTLVK